MRSTGLAFCWDQVSQKRRLTNLLYCSSGSPVPLVVKMHTPKLTMVFGLVLCQHSGCGIGYRIVVVRLSRKS